MKYLGWFLQIIFAFNTLLVIGFVMGYVSNLSYVSLSLVATWFAVFPVVMLLINVKDKEVVQDEL